MSVLGGPIVLWFSLTDVLSLAVLWKAYLYLSLSSDGWLIHALGLSLFFLFVRALERHSHMHKTMYLLHSLYVHLNDDQV